MASWKTGEELLGWQVDGTDSESCPFAGFGIRDVESSCTITRELECKGPALRHYSMKICTMG